MTKLDEIRKALEDVGPATSEVSWPHMGRLLRLLHDAAPDLLACIETADALAAMPYPCIESANISETHKRRDAYRVARAKLG